MTAAGPDPGGPAPRFCPRGRHGPHKAGGRPIALVAVVFEGGPEPAGALQATVQRLRQAVTLDTLDQLLHTPGVGTVVLATNRPHLAAAARRLGAAVHATAEPFHLHRELRAVLARAGATAALCLGGAAAPLYGPSEWQWVVRTVLEQAPCVVVNNPQSADVVAWSPAGALDAVPPQGRDNALGYLLAHVAGLPRVLLPNRAAVHFDLDTPTDYLVLKVSGRGGPRTRAALADLDWDTRRIEAAAAVLDRDLAEVGLVGRVGTAVVEYLNTYLRLRVRVFAEERGMKALGREEQGLVTSFLARVLADLGAERFFAHLGAVCHAVFFDSRVVFAAGGRRVSERDRFLSDLGQVEAIGDPFVRAFTAAALAAPVPVVLGGHSLVAGGLWLLAEEVLARRGGPRERYR